MAEESEGTEDEVADVVDHVEIREDLVHRLDEDTSVSQETHHKHKLVDQLWGANQNGCWLINNG